MVQQWNRDCRTVEHLMVKLLNIRWWNSRTSNGGTVEHPMVEEWNRDGGTLDHLIVQQWKRDGGTVERVMVEHLMVEQ